MTIVIEIYTDAATKGNPGVSYSGVYIKNNQDKVYRTSYLGTLSNHEAEFASACFALGICKDLYPGEIISLRTDSKIVVETFETGRCKNKDFQPYHEQLLRLAEQFSFVFMKWIPEKENKTADRLAKKALHTHLYE